VHKKLKKDRKPMASRHAVTFTVFKRKGAPVPPPPLVVESNKNATARVEPAEKRFKTQAPLEEPLNG